MRRAAKPLPRFGEGAREAGSGGVHDESGREVSPWVDRLLRLARHSDRLYSPRTRPQGVWVGFQLRSGHLPHMRSRPDGLLPPPPAPPSRMPLSDGREGAARRVATLLGHWRRRHLGRLPAPPLPGQGIIADGPTLRCHGWWRRRRWWEWQRPPRWQTRRPQPSFPWRLPLHHCDGVIVYPYVVEIPKAPAFPPSPPLPPPPSPVFVGNVAPSCALRSALPAESAPQQALAAARGCRLAGEAGGGAQTPQATPPHLSWMERRIIPSGAQLCEHTRPPLLCRWGHPRTGRRQLWR